MGQIRKQIKRLFKFGFMATALILFAWFYVLAWPSFLFAHEKNYGNFTVYSDHPIDQQTDSIIAEVKSWLEPIPIYNSATEIDIYLCNEEDQFGKIARFTLRQSDVMGFNLPEVKNCVINVFSIKIFGEQTRGQPRYHTREGNVAHVIAHELMHQFIADRYGSIAARSLPYWKTEGYCEYGANFVRTRSDAISLAERLRIYQTDGQWNRTAMTHREHYLWGIIIEYLTTRRGLTIDEIMSDSIRREAVYHQMLQGLSEDEAL